VTAAQPTLLTPRAVQVIAGYARGLSVAQVAEELDIGEATVKTHTTRSAKKAGITATLQPALVEYAYRCGYLTMQRAPRRPPLPPRLEQVLDCAARGLGHRATAAELGISPKTARVHRERLHRALGVHTTARAVAVAWETGLRVRPVTSRTTTGGTHR
jgi:DNA-binding NarL/FixJ family response regulator